MRNWPMIFVLVLTYIVFAILLNSVGTVILQVIHEYGVSKKSASILEGFKDIPIALVSFFVASFLPRIGYKAGLIIGLSFITAACFAMPIFPGFLTTKILFATLGASFAFVKVSIYASIGTITQNTEKHASLLNIIEGFFMVGVLAGIFLFSLFVENTPNHPNHWLNVYWWLGGLCLLNLFLLSQVTIPRVLIPEKTHFLQDFSDMIQLCFHKLVMVFIFSIFLYVLIEQSICTWLPTFNYELLHTPKSMSIQLAGIMAGALAVGRLTAGYLVRQIKWQSLMTICISGMAILLLVVLPLLANTHAVYPQGWGDAPKALFILPLIGLFMAPIYPAINSKMLSCLPKEQHAPMTGLIVVFSALGGTTGSMITGRIFESYGGFYAFYLLLVPLSLLYISSIFFNQIKLTKRLNIQVASMAG